MQSTGKLVLRTSFMHRFRLLPRTLIKFNDVAHLSHPPHRLAVNSQHTAAHLLLRCCLFLKAKPTRLRLTVTLKAQMYFLPISSPFPLCSVFSISPHVKKASVERGERKWGLMANAHHSPTNACWWNTLLILNTPPAKTVHLFSRRPLIDLSFLSLVLWK